MFMNTYGNYKEGVITHIGIVNSNNEFVHRPTMAKPVARDSRNWGRIAEIRHPRRWPPPRPPHSRPRSSSRTARPVPSGEATP
jgi:hypothetical protein